jgi:hypothetical protein
LSIKGSTASGAMRIHHGEQMSIFGIKNR